MISQIHAVSPRKQEAQILWYCRSDKLASQAVSTLPDGVNLILLCASKDGMCGSLGSLYWLINDFFFGGRAPIAFVVTYLDTLDERWWERNQDSITKRTGIPVQSIPHACVTTVQTGRDQSKQVLRALIRTYAAAIPPISPCLDLSSRTTASLDLITHCRLSPPDATALVEGFSRPRNIVFFGKAGAGKSSVINLIAGHPVANVTSDVESCTLDSSPYTIDTPMKQFVIWDTKASKEYTTRSGIDLLGFVKKRGNLTTSELNSYRLFEEFLCKGQVPVAVVVTRLECHEPMEQWWEMNGEGLLKAMSGNVIGHACITSLATHDQEDSEFSKNVSESRPAVRAMLEQCVSFPNKEVISAQLPANGGGETGRVPEKMTVDNLMDHCGLTREVANQVMQLWL
ncbi:hypothetical protein J3R82DRAFT_7304 [Butyriboletus roseoflavus]|nr:hypothetical protein J3R82DRAFT_7304 [Butyriboletus roseoflavus]